MNQMEARCVLNAKVGTHNRLEQSIINIFTVTKMGIVMRTIQDYMMFSVCFISDSGDGLKDTSADIHSVKEFAVYISQI